MWLIPWTLNNFTVFPTEKIIFYGKHSALFALFCPQTTQLFSMTHTVSQPHVTAEQVDVQFSPRSLGDQALAQPGGYRGRQEMSLLPVDCETGGPRAALQGPGPRGRGGCSTLSGGARGCK